jgi:gliding motility-associated-like protein
MRFTTTLIVTFWAMKLVAQTLQLPLEQGRGTDPTNLIEVGKDSFIYSTTLSPALFGGGKTSNLTHLSLSKGVLWSFDVQYPKTSLPSKLINFKEDFLWAGFISDVNQNKSLMRLNKKGDIIWSKRYGGFNDVDTLNNGKTDAIVLPDGNIALAGGAARFNATTKANDLFLTKLDPNGNQLWAKNYLFSNIPNTYTIFSNVINTTDGGYLLCGSIMMLERSILLLKTDANGTVEWTRTYKNDRGNSESFEDGIQVIQLPDGSFGLIINQSKPLEGYSNIIAQINANGTVAKALKVRADSNGNVYLRVNKAIYDVVNNAFVFSAFVFSISPVLMQQNLLYKIRLDGTSDWKYNYYDGLFATPAPNSDLVQTKNGNLAHLTTSYTKSSILASYPILIISDAKGVTGCEKPVNLTIEKNILLSTNTLNITEKNALAVLDYAVTKTPFSFPLKLPMFNLGNDTVICSTDTSFILDATDPNIDTYKWSTGETTPKITLTQSGKYAVTVTNTKFCLTFADTVSVTKSKKCSYKLDMANAFTPNGDGLNDSFGPFGREFTVQSFQIFNRWGNLVFEGNETNKAWNGQIKGENAASDVYVYALKYVVDGEVLALSGEVVLIR